MFLTLRHRYASSEESGAADEVHTLLVLGNEAEASTIKAAKQFAKSFPDILEFRSARRQGLALVRPDGYIAYSAHNGDSLFAFKIGPVGLQRQTIPTAGVERAA
jgi:hypothetical protein